VEGAAHSSNQFVECATMLVIGIILSVFGIGFLCCPLFNLAVYALPFFAGLTAGLAAYHSGAGVVGGILVGFFAGAVLLALGQVAFAAVRSPPFAPRSRCCSPHRRRSPAIMPRLASPISACPRRPGGRCSRSSAPCSPASRPGYA
jgi:hypothetical protein